MIIKKQFVTSDDVVKNVFCKCNCNSNLLTLLRLKDRPLVLLVIAYILAPAWCSKAANNENGI